ncbi:MAG: DNA polymerase II [Pseudomonadales bacterium]|nr:DNA polymerase II [Pseudomonadales bacterium]NRA17665.1 DNA polymerase II [Oceanospirillaceae bacterium]
MPEAVSSGFVLCSAQRDTEQGIELGYWLVTDQGPEYLCITGQEQVFFVLHSDAAEIRFLLRSIADWRLQELQLKDLLQQPVMGLYVSNLHSARKIINKLHHAHIVMMEEDIRPVDRYLMERFIRGAVAFSNTSEVHKIAKQQYHPRFNILSLDIETDMHLGTILCIGVQSNSGFKQVLMLGHGTDDDVIKYCGDERSLLQRYVRLINESDPDILIGWNVIGFDFSVIQQRAEQHQVALPIGRDGSVSDLHKSARGKVYLRIAGRIVLDGIDVLKGATFQFDSFSLENVSRVLLNRGKLVENVAHRADEIIEMYATDKQALAKYNLMDCELVLEIFAHAQLLEYLIERTALTGLPLDKVGGWSSAFDNLYLPLLHRNGYVAPEYASGVSDMASPGGYVMDSIPGLYRHVLVLDFKSLYPSIIRTFKIDPLGLAQSAICQDPGKLVPGFNGAVFTKEDNILPQVMDQLWQARDRAKLSNNQSMSQAIKILMSSMYGVLGSNACRFFDHRLSGSITLRGHEILTGTAKKIQSEYGYKVIYGDTDSVFVWLGDDCTDAQAHDIGAQLSTELTAWWSSTLTEKYAITSHLELEYETHYTKFLMPTMRDSELGTKKRYAGLQQFTDGRTEMVFKGMENVRSDWTELAKEMQRQVFHCAFNDLPYEQYIVDTVAAVRAGKLDGQLLYHKKLRQGLQEYQKNRPPHAQAALKLQQYYRAQNLREQVTRGQVIKYYITVNGPEPEECLSSRLDYDHYIDRQLKPALDALLSVKGSSFEQLVGLQRGLF